MPSMWIVMTCATVSKENPRARIDRGVGDIRKDIAPYDSDATATAHRNPTSAVARITAALVPELVTVGARTAANAGARSALASPPSDGNVTSPGAHTSPSKSASATPVQR